ncbi:hypothetical protein MN116_006894 [Schistosoma mekongi]|uniref:Uncharacterized protein n=1 Tax=Schistosoma mekongi TaxID=38744 RepID=A0AAE2D2Y2_SCHME|nr:hypothetical protein MN116_006894 [Schistosoma mekongi]
MIIMLECNKSSFHITLLFICLLYTFGLSVKYLHSQHSVEYYKYNYSQPIDVNEARAHQIDRNQAHSIILYVIGICVFIFGDILLVYSVLNLTVRIVYRSVIQRDKKNIHCYLNYCPIRLEVFHNKNKSI